MGTSPLINLICRLNTGDYVPSGSGAIESRYRQQQVDLAVSSYRRFKKTVLLDCSSAMDAFENWVSKLLSKDGDQEIHKELTKVNPPWNNVFAYFNYDYRGYYQGLHVQFADRRDPQTFQNTYELPSTVSHWVVTRWAVPSNNPSISNLYSGTRLLVVEQNALTAEIDIGAPDGMNPYLFPFFVFQLIHCKGVSTELESTYRPTLPRGHRNNKPAIRKYTLVISKNLSVSNVDNQTLETESTHGKSLHLCRGHFAHYTKEKPLFGHYVGPVWKPAHLRGSKEFGVIEKDYKL